MFFNAPLRAKLPEGNSVANQAEGTATLITTLHLDTSSIAQDFNVRVLVTFMIQILPDNARRAISWIRKTPIS
jgi:hypothetical protein